MNDTDKKVLDYLKRATWIYERGNKSDIEKDINNYDNSQVVEIAKMIQIEESK